MQIRPLTANDLDLIDEIDGTIATDRFFFVERQANGLNATFRIEDRALVEPRVESNPVSDDLRFTLKQVATGIEDGLTVMAEHDGVPIASLLATRTPDGTVIDLVDVRVDFDHRRDGLGTALMFQAINYAREGEARAVRAYVHAGNSPFIAMLVKLGFELAGLDTFRESNYDLVKERTTLVWYFPLV